MTDSPNAVDVRVGATIRALRKAQGYSQERLANAIGVTFQQLQKYEKGSNRVSASRLQDISHVLEQPISAFFNEGRVDRVDGAPVSERTLLIARLIDDLPLNQRHIIEQLVRSMTGTSSEPASSIDGAAAEPIDGRA